MADAWRAYQEQVAEFFRSLGCIAEVEKEVEGARGTHRVDVLVQTVFGGVSITWVIECKLWKTAVPKEKVLALAQIASDVGADRAFLLSESGFQAGAIRVAQNTNVTLTSLHELLESASNELKKRQLSAISEETLRLQRRLHDFYFLTDDSENAPAGLDREVILDLLSSVFEIHAIALPRVELGNFPVVISTGIQPTTLANFEKFVAHVRTELAHIKQWIATASLSLDK